MYKLTFTAVTVFAAVLVAFASTAAAHASKGGNRIVKSGTCSASSHEAQGKGGQRSIETEFEVDQNRVGKRWRVTISKNGTAVFRGIRTTQAPSGSFSVQRLLAGGAGSRIVATAKALASGETCGRRSPSDVGRARPEDPPLSSASAPPVLLSP